MFLPNRPILLQTKHIGEFRLEQHAQVLKKDYCNFLIAVKADEDVSLIGLVAALLNNVTDLI